MCERVEPSDISSYFAGRTGSRCSDLLKRANIIQFHRQTQSTILISLNVNNWYEHLYYSRKTELSCLHILEPIS